MKHYFYLSFIACFLLLAGTSHAQNLIPNGDFELGPDSTSIGWEWGMDSTGSITDSVAGPDFWSVVRPSPDRIVLDNFWWPSSGYDNDTAASGKAYCVFATNNFVYSASGEAGEVTLISPVQKDSSYKLSYYISFQTGNNNSSSITPSRIAFVFNGGDSIVSPYAATKQWQYHDTTFTASSNSTQMEITTVWDTTQSGVNVDAVSLEKVSSAGVSNLKSNPLFILYPNPVRTILYISTDVQPSSINVYNNIGQKVKIKMIKRSSTMYEINVSYLASGLYIIQVKDEKNGSSFVRKFFKFN